MRRGYRRIAFLGETGQGKSTIAASLGRQGFPVVTDDCLVVEEKEDEILGIPRPDEASLSSGNRYPRKTPKRV